MKGRSSLVAFAALAEVVVIFAVTHVVYRAIKAFTPVGRWEGAAGTNFTPGAVMIAVTLAMVFLFRRNFAKYGMSLQRWRQDLSLGVACAVALGVVAKAALALTHYHFDPTRPPDPHAPLHLSRIIQATLIGLSAFLAALAIVWRKRTPLERIPTFVSLISLAVLLALPPLAALGQHRPPHWPSSLWLFFGAGLGEEIFYRGYIQSRLDLAFGTPFHAAGLKFGVGLIVSSLLFGLVHALNTVDYFHGRFDFGWWYGVQSVCTGLFFGVLRARVNSIWPGAVVHGLTDVLARL